MLDHLSTLLEQKGLICPDGEWPIFGNDDEDDSRSITDQLLDIKSQIKSKDIHNNIKAEHSDKGNDLFTLMKSIFYKHKLISFFYFSQNKKKTYKC